MNAVHGPSVPEPSPTARTGRFRRAGLATSALGLALTTTTGVVAFAEPASAHASLVRSTPASGATLTTAPSRVVVTFDENVRAPSAIVVTGPGGRVSHGTAQVLDNTVSIDVAMRAAPSFVGDYDLAYRVVSADGHPVTGQVPFRYRPPGVRARAGAAAQPQGEVSSPNSHAGAWALGGAAVVGAGALLLGGRRLRRRGAR